MNVEDAKTKLKRDIFSAFPDCLHVDFSFDPEDKGIIYVCIYGIPDDKTYAAHNTACKAIDALGFIDDVEFVPSIISMTNTRLYHSELLPGIGDFDHPVSDCTLHLLVTSKSQFRPRPYFADPRTLGGWTDSDASAFLQDIDEDLHERNDIKLAA